LILEDPEPMIRLNQLGDSSVDFIVRPWAKTGDYWTVYWDVTREVKKRFDEEGISIPFPQRDIHVYQETAAPERNTTESPEPPQEGSSRDLPDVDGQGEDDGESTN
jgi:small-conductance mechanosensitive channel